MTIALRQRPLARVVMGIVTAANGAWFDPSDLSTLYQDAAGTIPVTAVEQPVGKMLDKSGNGYHATQSITASRPVLSARYNLLTKTEDFSDAVWIKTPLTTQSAKVLSFSAGANSRVTQVVSGSGDFTITAVFSSADVGKRIQLGFWASGIDGISASGRSGDLVIPDSGIVSFTKTGLVSMTNIGIINSADGVAKTVTLRDGFGVSLLPTSTLFQYQRVNTATDYDTDERYFKKFVRFDGVDDYLVLSGLNILGNFYVAAAVQYSGTAEHVIDSFGAAGIRAGLRRSSSKQLSVVDALATYSSSDIDDGLQIDSAIFRNNNSDLFKNTKLVQNFGTFARSGTITSANIGCNSSVTGGYHNGRIYGLILLSKEPTDAQRIACERHLSRKSGVTL